jgi:general secretion pathway protein G
LLLVMILGLLATLVVPNLIYQGDRARLELAKQLVSGGGSLARQIDLYKLHMGRYPDKLEDLTRLPDDPEERKKYGDEPYIKDANSLRDPWDQELQYKCPGEINKDSYDLYSFGPDKKESGGDDLGNWATVSYR